MIIMGSFPPMGQSRTINMFVSITEITMGSLGGFTRGSVLHCCTGKHTHAHTHIYKCWPYKNSIIPPPQAPALFPFLSPPPPRPCILLSLPSPHPIPRGGLNTTTPVIISHLWSLQHQWSKGTPGTSRQHRSCELLFCWLGKCSKTYID